MNLLLTLRLSKLRKDTLILRKTCTMKFQKLRHIRSPLQFSLGKRMPLNLREYSRRTWWCHLQNPSAVTRPPCPQTRLNPSHLPLQPFSSRRLIRGRPTLVETPGTTSLRSSGTLGTCKRTARAISKYCRAMVQVHHKFPVQRGEGNP